MSRTEPTRPLADLPRALKVLQLEGGAAERAALILELVDRLAVSRRVASRAVRIHEHGLGRLVIDGKLSPTVVEDLIRKLPALVAPLREGRLRPAEARRKLAAYRQAVSPLARARAEVERLRVMVSALMDATQEQDAEILDLRERVAELEAAAAGREVAETAPPETAYVH